jgi:N-acetylmuramoyl-L-alanine amidase
MSGGDDTEGEASAAAEVQAGSTPSTSQNLQLPEPAQAEYHVGIVAGHWQDGSGAVCPDGLREVDINLQFASLVASELRHRGYTVEVLPEFHARLDGYRADALVVLHAGNCDQANTSGFKAATLAGSQLLDESERLVNCLVQAYSDVTSLAYQQGVISRDMSTYHTFQEIAATTPGVVMELGEMASDREVLTANNQVAAEGIVQGIACFVEGG